jgi:hypothetical protein
MATSILDLAHPLRHLRGPMHRDALARCRIANPSYQIQMFAFTMSICVVVQFGPRLECTSNPIV